MAKYDAGRRKKHYDFQRRLNLVGIDDVVQKSKFAPIDRVLIPDRYKKPCRTVSFHSSWINTVSVSVDYTPILMRSESEDDRRRRVVAVTGSSGPSLVVFDIELGKKLFDIEGNTNAVYSVAVSNPSAASLNTPVIVSGSHDGTVKVFELQTGMCIHELGRHIHKGPVRCVNVFFPPQYNTLTMQNVCMYMQNICVFMQNQVCVRIRRSAAYHYVRLRHPSARMAPRHRTAHCPIGRPQQNGYLHTCVSLPREICKRHASRSYTNGGGGL
jgi:hypothetical protein